MRACGLWYAGAGGALTAIKHRHGRSDRRDRSEMPRPGAVDFRQDGPGAI